MCTDLPPSNPEPEPAPGIVRPEAAPPMSDSAADLLQTYLADRDVPCPGCGYNLRGHTGARCPECGVRLVLGVERGAALHLGRWLLLAAALSAMGMLAVCIRLMSSRPVRMIANAVDALFGSVRWRPWATWSRQDVTNCFLFLFWVAAEIWLLTLLIMWASASQPKAVERARVRLGRALLLVLAMQGAGLATMYVFLMLY